MKKRQRIPRKAKKKHGDYRRRSRRAMIDLYRSMGINPNVIDKRIQYTNYSESAARLSIFSKEKELIELANFRSNVNKYWNDFLTNENSKGNVLMFDEQGNMHMKPRPERVILKGVKF